MTDFMDYIETVDISPKDYDSEEEASLALPAEVKVFNETGRKFKVGLKESGTVTYKCRDVNDDTEGEINFDWAKMLNEYVGYTNLDVEVEVLREVSKKIIKEISNE